ncbi:MAG: NADH-dependent alcohol dehydrogenase [Bacteroidetes bacterium]|nr:MAG: NADH-dependent alcohol dehydrogenase [Bacteroidota bacterium]
MENFQLYNPVRILFGEGQTANINTYIPENARVLITYGGGSIKRNGVFEQVVVALGERKYVEFGGIEANPRYETLLKALPIIEQEGIDFILAVGGGSVIDGTKFIAAAAKYPDENKWNLIRKGRGATVKDALPFGTVLTISATGSEMNSGAVITKDDTLEKMAFRSEFAYPQFSVVDPAFTLSLPHRQVANGIVDAFVHVLEQYLTYPVGAHVQDRFSEGILQTLVEIGPKIMDDPKDLALRTNLSMCAMMALNGLIASGVPEDWSTHMIGHELTGFFNLDHALTLAIVLPHLLRDQQDIKQSKLAQMGERVFGITEGTENERATATIDAVESFLKRILGKIRLSEHGLSLEDIAKVWERIAERGWKLGERATVDAAAVRRILEKAL